MTRTVSRHKSETMNENYRLCMLAEAINMSGDARGCRLQLSFELGDSCRSQSCYSHNFSICLVCTQNMDFK